LDGLLKTPFHGGNTQGKLGTPPSILSTTIGLSFGLSDQGCFGARFLAGRRIIFGLALIPPLFSSVLLIVDDFTGTNQELVCAPLRENIRFTRPKAH
jgi:hypothetical protein